MPLLYSVLDLMVKPEGVSNVFLTKPVGVNENLGVGKHQKEVVTQPLTNRALALLYLFFIYSPTLSFKLTQVSNIFGCDFDEDIAMSPSANDNSTCTVDDILDMIIRKKGRL